MFYSFLSTDLLPPWLNLFLGTLFFLLLVNGIFSLVSLSDISLLVYKCHQFLNIEFVSCYFADVFSHVRNFGLYPGYFEYCVTRC